MNANTRFGDESLEDIQKNIVSNTPRNTIKSKTYVWKQFLQFCEHKKYQFEQNTPIEKLANILTDWAFNMRKSDGGEYKESVVKTLWNITAKLLQEKYHNEFKITFDPFKDLSFKTARDAKNSKRRQLQAIPEKRRNSSTALTSIDLDNIIKSWDEDTPNGLQRKFFHIAAVELAWRGGEAVACMTKFFSEEINNDGTPTGRLQYNPIFTKTTQGGSQKTCEPKWLATNVFNKEKCPVRLFKKLMSKRGPNIKSDRLFLTPNLAWSKNANSPWYKNMPIGVNEINKWTKSAAERIGLATNKIKITNHSNRATAVSLMASSGIGEQQIIKITGHNTAESIKPYLQLSRAHHENIVTNLRNQNDTPTASNEYASINNNTNCSFCFNIYQNK